jgi:hypothetical protein
VTPLVGLDGEPTASPPSASAAILACVRVMFAAYVLIVAVGLTVYIAVGLLHR